MALFFFEIINKRGTVRDHLGANIFIILFGLVGLFCFLFFLKKLLTDKLALEVSSDGILFVLPRRGRVFWKWSEIEGFDKKEAWSRLNHLPFLVKSIVFTKFSDGKRKLEVVEISDIFIAGPIDRHFETLRNFNNNRLQN